MPGIFLSYRNIGRSYAPMLIDRELSRRFGSENVFQAGRSNLPATAFPDAIQRRLEDCSVMIVLMDPPWVGEDLALLFDPCDWVRREVLYALAYDKEILPILLDGAEMPRSRELPAELAPVTRRIALRMSSRTADADLVRLLGEVERLAPDLVVATLMDPDPPKPTRPASLLRAEQQVFPLRERPQLYELTNWCLDPTGAAVRLVTGPAGAGKTRLALALCAQLRAKGRPCGLLSISAPPQALQRLGEITTACLVVIDGAEARPEQVRAALRALASTPRAPSRLLLLARAGAEWLERLRDDPDDRVADLVDGVAPLPLAPLSSVDGDFDLACTRFASQLGIPVPPAVARPVAPTLLETQAAALGHVLSPDGAGEPPLRLVLRIEREYWRRTALAFGLPELSTRDIAEIMTVVTLFGAKTEAGADALIGALPAFRGMPARTIDVCRDLLRTVLPGPAPLNPVQPAHLAEDVIAEHLGSEHRLDDLIDTVTDDQLAAALLLLGQSLDRHPELTGPLAGLLARDAGRRMPIAIPTLAALAQPERFAQSLSQALELIADTDLDHVVAALPERSDVLAQFAATATRRALSAHRAAGVPSIATARLARQLAWRLADLGERPREVISVAREAVDEIAALARTSRANDGEILAELAAAHATLALALDRDPAEAEGALAAGAASVARYESLPDTERNRRDLARALHNQSVRLSRGPDTGAALAAARRAHELTTALDAVRPAHNRSLHADVTGHLASLTAAAGERDEAEQLGRAALRLWRVLAAARPDAYQPHLAAALYNLGAILTHKGDDVEEVRAVWTESVASYDTLHIRQPGRYDEQRTKVRDRLDRLDRLDRGDPLGRGEDD